MERETKTIATPAGKELILKAYLTARERNQLRDIFASEVKVDPTTNQALGGISGLVMSKAQDKLIELSVVSYEGSAENVMDRVLDSDSSEYDFILNEANKAGEGVFRQAK